MPVNCKPKSTDSAPRLTEYQRYCWLRQNRGRLTEIAKTLGVSRSYVSQVFRGIKRNQTVSRAIFRNRSVYNMPGERGGR